MKQNLSLKAILFLVSTSVATLWGEIIALSLLLENIDVATLPIILLLEALLWSLIANLEVRAHIRASTLLSVTGAGVLLIVLPSYFVFNFDQGYIVVFLAHSALANTFAQHTIPYLFPIYTARHGRENLVQIIVIARIALLALALALIPVAMQANPQQLVSLWMGTIVLSIISIGWLSQAEDNTNDQQISPTDIRYIRKLLKRQLIRWLVANALSVAFLTAVVFYQVADYLNQRYSAIDDLVIFFSLVGAAGILVTLPAEIWMFSSMARQFNARKMAWIYPALLSTSFLGIMFTPALTTAAFGNLTRAKLLHNLYAPVERLLHRALPDGEEGGARYIIYAFVHPLGRLVASLLLGVALVLHDQTIILGVGISVGFLFLVAIRRSGFIYGQTLAASLRAGQYRLLRRSTPEWGLQDQTQIEDMMDRLKLNVVDDQEFLLIAEVIAQSGQEEAYQVLQEVWHERCSADQKTELLPLIVGNWPDKCDTPETQSLVSQALASDFPGLRRQALLQIADHPSLDPEHRITRFLIDPDPVVNTIAASILLKHPLPRLRKAARAQLRWLAKDNQVSIRVMAVKALVEGSQNAFGEIVEQPFNVAYFLNDPATRVRETALPAASTEQLLDATFDSAPNVRAAAARLLYARRFQGARKLLLQRMDQIQRDIAGSGNIQIEDTLRYWRLLVALTVVNRRSSHKRLRSWLTQGFDHLALLENQTQTLRQLDLPAFGPLIGQLERDANAMLNTVIEYMSGLVGKERFQAIVWTLRADTGETEKALQALRNLTTPELADRFYQALHGQLSQRSRLYSTLPHIALNTLLAQRDAWRPLLVLYCLSLLPADTRHTWISPEQVESILAASASSQRDVIREGARLIYRRLEGKQEEVKEGQVMLSTLERMLFLRNVSFFSNLHLDQLRALARGCEEITAKEGDRIIAQGEVGQGLFIIVEGQVRIERRTPDGRRATVLTTMGPSEVVGEISLLDGGVRTADVIAETPVLMLSIQHEALHAALEDDPTIAMTMLKTMAQRLRQSAEMAEQRAQTREMEAPQVHDLVDAL